jgi:23S rRNA pseudouridine2605 synthase
MKKKPAAGRPAKADSRKSASKGAYGKKPGGKPANRFDGADRFRKTYGTSAADGQQDGPVKNSDREVSKDTRNKKTSFSSSERTPGRGKGDKASGRKPFSGSFERSERGESEKTPGRSPKTPGRKPFPDSFERSTGRGKSEIPGGRSAKAERSTESGKGDNAFRSKNFSPAERAAAKKLEATRDRKPFSDDDRGRPGKKPYGRKQAEPGRDPENFGWHKDTCGKDRYEKKSRRGKGEDYYGAEDTYEPQQHDDGPMPLNKYIAHSGVCGRREAATLVKQGRARVNGELILEPGHKVMPGDTVTLSGKKLIPQKGLVYVLLNKPKGYITTTEDPKGRKTVMDLVAGVNAPRIFPVGRLDRNTTGLLLITNDGMLAQKLAHPRNNVKKIYQVTLDKPLAKADFDKILAGVELEDGVAPVDALSYLSDKRELGIEIHSGRNRIVRRIFEALGYEVVKLDRVMYAGLTKKNIPRGKWRFLTEREVILLKHFKN